MDLPIRPCDFIAQARSDDQLRSHLDFVVDEQSHVRITEGPAHDRRQPLSGVRLAEQETREAVAEVSRVRRVRQTCFKITEEERAAGTATNSGVQVNIIVVPYIGSELHLMFSVHPRHTVIPYKGVGPLG